MILPYPKNNYASRVPYCFAELSRMEKISPTSLAVYRNGIPVHGEEKVQALLAWRRQDRSVFVPGFLPEDVDFSSLGLTKK